MEIEIESAEEAGNVSEETSIYVSCGSSSLSVEEDFQNATFLDSNSTENTILEEGGSSLKFDSLSSSENAEPTTALVPQKKKWRKSGRKPSFRPEFMPAIRIFRNDIRRRYGDMFVNVVNSSDYDLMAKFFYQFCVPNISFEQSLEDGSKFSKFVQSIYSKETTSGIATFTAGMVGISKIFVDGVSRLLNFQVRVQKGVPGCRLIGRLSFEASLLYDAFRPAETASEEKKPLPYQGIEFTDITSNETVYLSLLPTPVPLTLTSLIEMHLDDAYQITFMKIVPQNGNNA